MKHNDYDYEHFTESLREAVMMIVWTSLLTLVSVGAILAIAIKTM